MRTNFAKLRLSGDLIFSFFTLWACISSVFILLYIKYVDADVFVYALKDLPVYVAMLVFAALWVRSVRVVYSLVAIGLFVIYLSLNLIILNPGYENPIANIRQLVAPLVMLLFFCSLRIDLSGVIAVERVLNFAVWLVFSWGVLEFIFELWKAFDLSMYFTLKGIPVDAHGLSYMFYEPMLGYRERMTSTFLDPISLGHFFATVSIYFLYVYGFSSQYRITIIVCLVGLLLCFSKGAFLQFFIAITFLNSRVHVYFKVASVLGPLAFFYFSPNKDGMFNHIFGLWNSILNISFFGHGIGSVGNYAKMFSSDLSVYYRMGISDTYFGALLGQVGFFGAFIWFAIIVYVISPFKKGLNIDFILLSSILIVSVVSENTLNVTSFLVPAIVIAMAHRRKFLQNA